jgi:hypothetical protein
LKNTYNFHKKVVDKAASVINRWWRDEELGMCRAVRFGGHRNEVTNRMEPVMHYAHVNADTGEIEDETSTLVEVLEWVEGCTSNI